MKTDIDERKAKKLVKAMLKPRLEAVGQYVESEARLRARVDGGGLKGSISHKVIDDNTAVRIGSNKEYAGYIEFGTGEFAENKQGRKGGWVYKNPKTGDFVFTYGMKPKPFLRPAIYDNKQSIKKILTK